MFSHGYAHSQVHSGKTEMLEFSQTLQHTFSVFLVVRIKN